MRKARTVLGLAAVVGVLAVLLVGPAGAAPNPPGLANNPMLGVVTPFSELAFAHNAGGSSGAGKLRYHNGPVQHGNTTYGIYWVPAGFSVASDYQTLIDRFLGDVAADSGKTSNVYYSDTQYYDGAGHVPYSSAFAGSIVDTNPYPASGCSDTVAQTSVCLTDGQLQAEIQRVVANIGWPVGGSTEYFLFTAKGVGSCSGSSCAFSYFCAYHSWIGSGATEILYANQPYTDTVPSACDATAHPNNSEADPTINVVSHEHNETITDPNGNAWYDNLGYENGDKCAWNFGANIGSTPYGSYNQLINGNPYELQQEFSNTHNNCVLTGT